MPPSNWFDPNSKTPTQDRLVMLATVICAFVVLGVVMVGIVMFIKIFEPNRDSENSEEVDKTNTVQLALCKPCPARLTNYSDGGDKITGTWTNVKQGDEMVLHEYDHAKPIEYDANSTKWELKVLTRNDSGGGVGRYITHLNRKQKHRIPVLLTPLQHEDEPNEGTIFEAVGMFSFYSDKGTIFITGIDLLTQGNIDSCSLGKDGLLRGTFLKLPQLSDQSQGYVGSFIRKKTVPLSKNFDQRWENLYNKGQAILEKKVDLHPFI